MLLGLPAAIGAALVFGVAAVLLAVGVRRLPTADGLDLHLVARMSREPACLASVALNLAGFLLHLVALRSLPLFLAQAAISASLAVTAVVSVRVLSRPLSTQDWWAVAAVTTGLVLLAAAAGPAGEDRAGERSSLALTLAVGVTAAVGIVSVRRRGAWGAVLLGLTAGLGFAVVAISARLLPEIDPVAVVRDPVPAVALVVSGALAFVLYALALQRGSVMATTAPMIVAQTVAPALVGLALLGDAVRPGWAAVAVFGLVLAGGGAVALAHVERVHA